MLPQTVDSIFSSGHGLQARLGRAVHPDHPYDRGVTGTSALPNRNATTRCHTLPQRTTERGTMIMTPRSTITRSRLILAVEDDEDHLLAYGIAFGREPDLRLITATNTRAAGIALRAHSVDAVLLDLSIPKDGGIALCRRIKAQPRFHYLPVIALSALPAEIYAASALAAGCCAFLQKPCTLSSIVAEVRRRLVNEIAVDDPDSRATTGCGILSDDISHYC